jgi:RNA polymerase-binding protein DksA
MLTQGHVASKSLTKKGTFIPTKLPAVAPKPLKRKIERPEPAFVTLQPPVVQVKTSEKAVKNKAGLGQKDLDFFRDLLLQKRRELVGDMSHMEREALRENNANATSVPVDPTDQGTDSYEQEFTLGLVEKDRTLLREINDAMAKLQNGTYGICEGTGNPISRARLEAQPWARHSIEFARILEKRKMVFRR